MNSGGFVEFLKKTYASADPRSLGVFRIALGALMFFDVLRRYPEVETHYSNAGWLTNHFMLFRPMSEHLLSVYLAFSSPNEVRFLMQIHLLICVLFMIGWRTRLMHVLLVLLLVSINSRNIMIENGGFVVLTVLAVWTAFLPLGARFSVDAIRASLRLRRETEAEALNDRNDPPRRTEPVVSLAVVALVLQWVVIYVLNVLHKNGPEWKDGTAVYYLFQQDRVITGFADWVRGFIPLGGYRALTYAGLGIEALIPLLLLVPVWTTRARLLAWALAAALHLSIAAIVDLGPFSWAMIIPFIVFVPGSIWESLEKRYAGRYPRFDVFFERSSGFFVSFCRVVKRFDVLGHVRFVPLTAGVPQSMPIEEPEEEAPAESDEGEDDDDDGDGDEEDEEGDDERDDGKAGDGGTETARGAATSEKTTPVAKTESKPPAKARVRALVVEDVRSHERFGGIAAIFALAKAVPYGTLLTLPLRIPGIKGFIAKRLARATRHPREFDEYFAVETLPNEPERRAPEPTAARLALGKTLGAFRESLVVVFLIACALQLFVENPGGPAWLHPRQPIWMRALVVYPRMFQGWSMFAPSPPLSDSRLVVDGVTADGRHLDPLTGEAPVFEVAPPSARRMNQIWGDFHRRVGERNFEPYLEGVKDFIRRHHDVVKQPKDKLTAFQAWYVTATIPPPGEKKKPSERRLLFSEGVMPENRAEQPGPYREP